ncbi:tetratricopeptide repeat protein [Desulfococcaceae bacterium HSG7]|nr:tetratricopeptide repeat protein [Desulfococcaceae bacterium HSG7]
MKLESLCNKSILVFLVSFFLSNGFAVTSEASAKRELFGNVYVIGTHDQDEPVSSILVYIEETGDSNLTTPTGAFRILLKDIFKAGKEVTLGVLKKDWRILYPLDGVVRVPANLMKERIKVRLDKLGSHRFFSNEYFESIIEKGKEEEKKYQAGNKEPKIDLGRYIKEWAVKYGFSFEQVRAELDKWATEIDATSTDLYKLGLADFYKKQFGEAAENFKRSANRHDIQLSQVSLQEKQLYEKKKRLIAKVIRDYEWAGDAYYNDRRYKDALTAYQKALAKTDRATAPKKWASLLNDIGKTFWKLGQRSEGKPAQQHLHKAVQAYRDALTVYTRETLPQDWAATKNNLGIALQNQGIRTGGEAGARLLGEAVLAYRDALTVYTRETLPQDWAMTQNNLGIALQSQGIRTGGEAGARLLGEAVQAYGDALKVYTRETLPQDWAATKNNLGTALREQGIRTGGEAGARLLGEAVQAYRDALTVYTRETLPQQWATTKNNLGNALSQQGIRTGGEAGARLLGKAVRAYRDALTVRTRETLPQDWAMTQNNLGTALKSQGIRTGGEAGARLLGEAVLAYRDALKVYTRETLPQDWAMTQNNLGNALSDQGIRTGGEAGARLLGEAVLAYRDALTVRTRETLPQDWAGTQNNLGAALKDRASKETGDKQKQLFQEAVKSFKHALEIYQFKYLPRQWGITQNNLAETYDAMGQWAEAADCYLNVLKAYPAHTGVYQRASFILHERLFQFEKAYQLDQKQIKAGNIDLALISNFLAKHFTTGRFDEGDALLAKILPELDQNHSLYTPLTAIEIAILTAQGKNDTIPGKLNALIAVVEKRPEKDKIGWTFNGVKHYIKTEAKLAPHHDWLLRFFTALEAEKRDSVLKGLRSLQASFEQ